MFRLVVTLHPETPVTFDLGGMDRPGNKNRGLLCRSGKKEKKKKHLLD